MKHQEEVIPAEEETMETGDHMDSEEHHKEENQMNDGFSSEERLDPYLLLEEDEAEDYRSDWREIQTRFVDDPEEAVESADELVSDLMDTITSTLAAQRDSLERQWSEGNEPSTEELRRSMMRYRSFFHSLLTLESSETEESVV